MVTGAAGLIGQQAVMTLAEAGAQVVATDLADIPEAGQVENVRADISDAGSIRSLMRVVQEALGGLDILVHCAAIDAKFDQQGDTDQSNIAAFDTFPLNAWQKSVQVNVDGTFLILQAALTAMTKGSGGVIVTLASTYSLVSPNPALYQEPDGTAKIKPVDYVATKSLVPNLTRYIAAHYGERGIRANCFVPHGVTADAPQWFEDNFSRLSPLGRLSSPDEMRGPLLFLCSDASSYMTGGTLVFDGGWTAW